MANETTENELLALEHQYWQAIKDGDVALSARLSADPCVVTGSQGVGRIDRVTLEGMFASAAWKLTGFEITSPIVELLTGDVAVVAYRVHEDLLVDGQPLALDASDSSTWVRRNGEWVCAVHTEAIAGDPFGRDRGR
jgi:ketosteroid isomerase-like protein